MASCGENRKSTALTVRTLYDDSRAEHFYSYNVIKHRTFSRKLSQFIIIIQKCRELGWVCVLLAVETYGC